MIANASLHAAPVAAAPVDLAIEGGFPPAIDALAAHAMGGRTFLRSAWYRGAAPAGGRTVIARRADGSLLAAVPTIEKHAPLVQAHVVPGSYWPFRSMLVDAYATPSELAGLFSRHDFRTAMSPVWRMGPVYRDEPAIRAVLHALSLAGWTVLSRTLGSTFVLDTQATQWPRKSTCKRLAAYARQLGENGELRFETITGADWSAAAIGAMAAIEATSWVGTATDGSGAKFLTSEQRGLWLHALNDPVIARAASATILYVGDAPAAFTFDLQDGDVQYSIASSYDARFAAFRPGKIVTYHQMRGAIERGVRRFDLGAGDSGYKREMGAVAASEIVDLLIIRNRSVAQIVGKRWGAVVQLHNDPSYSVDTGVDVPSLLKLLAVYGTIAFAAFAAAE